MGMLLAKASARPACQDVVSMKVAGRGTRCQPSCQVKEGAWQTLFLRPKARPTKYEERCQLRRVEAPTRWRARARTRPPQCGLIPRRTGVWSRARRNDSFTVARFAEYICMSASATTALEKISCRSFSPGAYSKPTPAIPILARELGHCSCASYWHKTVLNFAPSC